MIDISALTPAERRLIPAGRLEGPTPYVIAIMMFVMVVIAAAGLALAEGARLVSDGIANRYSVQIAGGATDADRVARVVRSAPGVGAVRPVPEGEMRATLERWLGPDGASADLPLPVMIDVDLAPGADADAVGRRIAAAVPGARFVAHSQSLGPILGAVRALGWLSWTLVALIAAATAAAVILATRGALDTHRATIEVMHGVGASDAQVARLFQRKIAIDAMVGGTIGTLVAALVLIAVAGGGSRWLADLSGGALIGPGAILLLAGFPIAGTFLAAVVARSAVLRALRGML